MTAPADPPHEGTIGAITDLGGKMIGALPPAFLMLCVVNLVFLGMVVWFINHQATARTELVDKLIDRCMSIALQAQPPH